MRPAIHAINKMRTRRLQQSRQGVGAKPAVRAGVQNAGGARVHMGVEAGGAGMPGGVELLLGSEAYLPQHGSELQQRLFLQLGRHDDGELAEKPGVALQNVDWVLRQRVNDRRGCAGLLAFTQWHRRGWARAHQSRERAPATARARGVRLGAPDGGAKQMPTCAAPGDGAACKKNQRGEGAGLTSSTAVPNTSSFISRSSSVTTSARDWSGTQVGQWRGEYFDLADCCCNAAARTCCQHGDAPRRAGKHVHNNNRAARDRGGGGGAAACQGHPTWPTASDVTKKLRAKQKMATKVRKLRFLQRHDTPGTCAAVNGARGAVASQVASILGPATHARALPTQRPWERGSYLLPRSAWVILCLSTIVNDPMPGQGGAAGMRHVRPNPRTRPR